MHRLPVLVIRLKINVGLLLLLGGGGVPLCNIYQIQFLPFLLRLGAACSSLLDYLLLYARVVEESVVVPILDGVFQPG